MTQCLEEFRDREGTSSCALEQGLAALANAATALGANTIAVLVLDSTCVEIAYGRTEAGLVPPRAPIPCGLETRLALDNSPGPVRANSSLAQFLTSAVAPAANSFLLFPWRARLSGVTIVFGFERPEPAASVPCHMMDTLNLAALAVWSVKEVSRLHAELRMVNRSFAGMKRVERVKGILQTERGMSEQEAYEFLRRTSRQRRISISKLAEDLLAAPGWP